jgi:hypothetical protein
MKQILSLTSASSDLLQISLRALACALLLGMMVCLALPVTALAQACPSNPNPTIEIIESSETRQHAGLCQSQGATFDEVQDFPVFVGPCLVSITRFINHVTVVSASNAPACQVGAGATVVTLTSTTSTSSASETRENPNLCQGGTSTYSVVLTKTFVTATTSTVQVGAFSFFTVINFNTDTNTHTLNITEVGTKPCNVPITVIEDEETRQNPNLCQGETKKFDEISEESVTQTVGGITFVKEIIRFINHVTEVGTKECELPQRCRYTLSPEAASFFAKGGQGSFEVKVEKLLPDADCRWSVVASPADWIEITSGGGQETGNVEFSVKPNSATAALGGAIHVIGDGVLLDFLINQAANPMKVSLSDPAACLAPDGIVGITAYLTNSSTLPVSVNFTAALPPQLIGKPGSCSTTVGSCLVEAESVTWSGTLAPGQTVPINYRAQIATGAPSGASLTINNEATFNGTETATLPYQFKVTCPDAAAAYKPQFCGAASFVVPLLTRGLTATPALPDGDLFLLKQPLTMTITSSDAGGQSFTVNTETFGSLRFDNRTGLLNVTTQGLSLSTPNSVIRAISCNDSFRSVSFEIASTGTAGDTVRLFRQDPNGGGVQELAVFTVQADGASIAATYLHPDAALFLNNRLASGAGKFAANAVIALETATGNKGKRTGLLTLALGDAQDGCFQLGIDLTRAGGDGSISVALTDAVVNRQEQANSANQQGTGLFGSQDIVPTGLPCQMSCAVCPIKTKPNDCSMLCLQSPQYYLLNLDKLPNGMVYIGGVNFNAPVSTSNSTAVKQSLLGGESAMQKLNRGYVTAQLSLLRAGMSLGAALRGRCSCNGVSFAPVMLSSRFILSPNTTLGELLDQARRAILEKREGDMAELAQVFELINYCR